MIYRFRSTIRKTLLGEDVYFCVLIDGVGKYPSPIIHNYSWAYGKLSNINKLNNKKDISLDEITIDDEGNKHLSDKFGNTNLNTKVISDFTKKEVDWVEYYFQDVLGMKDYFKLEQVEDIEKTIVDLPADKEIIGIEDVDWKNNRI